MEQTKPHAYACRSLPLILDSARIGSFRLFTNSLQRKRNSRAMSTSYVIEPFARQDIEPVAQLWRTVFPDCPLSIERVKGHTFGNPQFDPAGGFVARIDNHVLGFGLATTMCIPEIAQPEDSVGFIPLVMVLSECRNQGIGKALLQEAELYLSSLDKTRFVLGYPTYVRGSVLSLLGVRAQCKEAFWFFRHFGYKVTSILDSAVVSLAGYQVPECTREREKKAAEERISVGALKTSQEQGLLTFLKQSYPGSWYSQYARRAAGNQLVHCHTLIVRKAREIIGFAGPFDIPATGQGTLGIGIGLKEEFRGKGLGNILLCRALEAMKNNGAKECHIYGVGPKRFYDKVGFRLHDLWIMLAKEAANHRIDSDSK